MVLDSGLLFWATLYTPLHLFYPIVGSNAVIDRFRIWDTHDRIFNTNWKYSHASFTLKFKTKI